MLGRSNIQSSYFGGQLFIANGHFKEFLSFQSVKFDEKPVIQKRSVASVAKPNCFLQKNVYCTSAAATQKIFCLILLSLQKICFAVNKKGNPIK